VKIGNRGSDEQGYVAIDDISFGFQWSLGDGRLIDFPPAGQYCTHGEGTE